MKYFSILVLLFAVFVLFASAQEKTAEEVCRQPKLVGRCRAKKPRFYYNVASGECENFFYGGCDGNDNNFNTKEECEAKCAGITAA